MLEILFPLDVIILLGLLAGAVWSVAVPHRRLWPPPGKGSWQHRAAWAGFYAVFGLNAVILVFDWNSGSLEDNLRFVLGVPLVVLGSLLVSWGMATLGLRNTSGLQAGFVARGPYRFTRNPQYLGDMILFIGLSLIANSNYLWVTHGLTILVFLVTPLAEETWLEEQYGEDYIAYRRGTARFL